MADPIQYHPEMFVSAGDVEAYRRSFCEVGQNDQRLTPWLAEISREPLEVIVPDGWDEETAVLWAETGRAIRADRGEFIRRYGGAQYDLHIDWVETYQRVTGVLGRMLTRACGGVLLLHAAFDFDDSVSHRGLAAAMGAGALGVASVLSKHKD